MYCKISTNQKSVLQNNDQLNENNNQCYDLVLVYGTKITWKNKLANNKLKQNINKTQVSITRQLRRGHDLTTFHHVMWLRPTTFCDLVVGVVAEMAAVMRGGVN